MGDVGYNPTICTNTPPHLRDRKRTKPHLTDDTVLNQYLTISGDTYSCVDFYKQPAFDHPALQNHSYHPDIEFDSFPLKNISQINSWISKLWANGEGCPIGTVPIRKYTKSEFISTLNLFRKLYPTDEPVRGRFRSCVHTLNGEHTFHGGSAAFSIYNFPVGAEQYSASYQIIRKAEDQLQFGWTINPIMYKDGQTRIFLTTKVEKTRCFNQMCGGFILATKDVPLDLVLPNTTHRGDKHSVELVVKMVREADSKRWSLRSKNDFVIGYWPDEVLKGLQGPAEYLEWGGEAFNPPDKGLKGPPMGSGFFPVGFGARDGYASQLRRYDSAGAGSMIGGDETEMYSDDNSLYRVLDGGFIDKEFGHMAYFGGAGA
uniref:Neprosin PEP catalytic domain-containing protein n=1 Tax=Kalanchoe fedtschenkoi TaxID=63787 RepID=A0A7N0VHZ0_KALFE